MEEQINRLSPAVGARLALARHPGTTGAVGTVVLGRGTNSHEGSKQTGSEQLRYLCVPQALVGSDRRMEDVEHRQRVVALEACATYCRAVGSGTWDIYRVTRVKVHSVANLQGIRCVLRGVFIWSVGLPISAGVQVMSIVTSSYSFSVPVDVGWV